MHKFFSSLCKSQPFEQISEITSTMIINYKAHLGSSGEWKLGSLRGFLNKWHSLGYPGVGLETVQFLDSLRIGGNRKGHTVLTMDPILGPFTENEVLAIHAELCNQFSTGEINTREFALIWLFMALGQRSVQYAMLKAKDFQTLSSADGSVRYLLKVPRAKQRAAHVRELFSDRLLCKEAGTALATLINQTRDTFHAKIGGDIAPEELPIFPHWGDEVPGLGPHHMTSHKLADELVNILTRLQPISERTGEPMKFNSNRFKYTIGTRAAEEGHGELVIAQLLDHSDTQNVRVYVEATPKFAKIIDAAMQQHIAPRAQAFKGMVIKSDQECPDGIRIGSSSGETGRCGNHGFCDAAAPYVCYVCVNFRPWLDGPHEDILKELLSERERLAEITNDKRIVEAKDRLIMAVSQVIDLCRTMK
jgi:hypothetical protein